MHQISRSSRIDYPLLIGVLFLIAFGTLILHSTAGYLFPQYFLFIALSLIAFFIFMRIEFSVMTIFSKYFYIGSVVFLVLPLLLGQVSRGAVRWIPVGALTVQPAEIIKPFLLIYFATYFFTNKKNLKTFVKSLGLLIIPVILVLLQPSLGVAILLVVGFVGVFLASGFNWKYYIASFVTALLLLPILFILLAPYQKQRILSFISPLKDPLGAGYNSIQSMISIGSGGVMGEGLGKGIQTQLAFLPEKHTDFIFASTAEELGFIGASMLILGAFFVLFRLIKFIEKPSSISSRAYLSGLFLMLFVQVIVNISMNLGLLPITGLPLPLVSAGGSSLLSTTIALGIAMGARGTKANTL